MNFATDSIHRHCSAQAVVDTPLGPLRLARTGSGLAGAWFDGQKHHPGEIDAPLRPDDPLLCRAAGQLADYFAGGRAGFDLPLDLQGTAFQRAVWSALQRIGAGTTVSYGAVARELGMASAVRAVGAAVGRNPVSVIVPCHRVIASDGAPTGYAGGMPRKLALLRLEAAQLSLT